ncbi:MAG: heme-binding protein [Jatrophihabitans sp.]
MTEQQPFEVVRRYDGFELRRYPSHVVAEVTVELPFEQAGNMAFRYLFGYITGQNRSRSSIAMTSPVTQSAGAAQKVAMTAPVTQRSTEEGEFVVAFVLPASMTEQTAPEPTDPHVSIRTVPPSLAAVTRYSGRWSQDSYERHRRFLLQAIEAEGLKVVGTPRFARFDPPFKPSFLRHNEVVVDVDESPAAHA